jgi:hypothetical protein
MSSGFRAFTVVYASLVALACASTEELTTKDSGADRRSGSSTGAGSGTTGTGGTGGNAPTTTGGSTGGAGSGGATGTGGFAGARGGTSGAGGTGGTGTGGTGGGTSDASLGDATADREGIIDAGTCTTCQLRVQYRAADTNATDNQIKPHFNIVNVGTTSVPLRELTIRYWYTADGDRPQIYWCDYALIGCSNVTGKLVAMSTPVGGADSYLEIGFTAGAGTLAASGQTGEIQNRFNKDNYANYNEADDYSFDPARTVFSDWMRVTLYHNGGLVWGVDPACANAGGGATCGADAGADADDALSDAVSTDGDVVASDVATDVGSSDTSSDASSTDASSLDVAPENDAVTGESGATDI